MQQDPLDIALTDFIQSKKAENIIIQSDLAEDDIMEVDYYFRAENDLPVIEQKALAACQGKVLDVGACVGAHTIPLIEKGFDVTALDTSYTAMQYLKEKGIKTINIPFMSYTGEKYDTLLLLMNGIGLAGKLNNLEAFLTHCYALLNEGGKIICDSTDVTYFYEDDEGAQWVNLNASYYGDFKFKMKYKSIEGEWFDWVYVDIETLKSHAEKAGFSVNLLYEEPSTSMFLVELTK